MISLWMVHIVYPTLVVLYFHPLVGLNFDRVWEGTMSDMNYDPEICRNIMVDLRYVLFIVDKYAGAKHLIDEMTLVHPKKASGKKNKKKKKAKK